MKQQKPPSKEAVALRYDSTNEGAPRVVAKGKNEVADRIISLAKQHGVALWEDRDLVQMLGLLELGAEIPPRLYRALAEILAHLYRLEAQRREKSPGTYSERSVPTPINDFTSKPT